MNTGNDFPLHLFDLGRAVVILTQKMRQIDRNSVTQKTVQRAGERRGKGEAEWREANTHRERSEETSREAEEPGGLEAGGRKAIR